MALFTVYFSAIVPIFELFELEYFALLWSFLELLATCPSANSCPLNYRLPCFCVLFIYNSSFWLALF